MKKLLLAVAAVSLFICSAVQAQFVDEAAEAVSVAQAKKLSNGSWVVLEGFITKRMKDDQYTFRDSSGDMRIIVRNSSWQGVEVSPKTKVRITGQIEKAFFAARKIKVNKVELARK